MAAVRQPFGRHAVRRDFSPDCALKSLRRRFADEAGACALPHGVRDAKGLVPVNPIQHFLSTFDFHAISSNMFAPLILKGVVITLFLSIISQFFGVVIGLVPLFHATRAPASDWLARGGLHLALPWHPATGANSVSLHRTPVPQPGCAAAVDRPIYAARLLWRVHGFDRRRADRVVAQRGRVYVRDRARGY